MHQKSNEERKIRRIMEFPSFEHPPVLNKPVLELSVNGNPRICIDTWDQYHGTMIPIDVGSKYNIKEIITLFETTFNLKSKLVGSSVPSSTEHARFSDRSYWYRLGEELEVVFYTKRIWAYSSNLDNILKIEELLENIYQKSDNRVYYLTSTTDGITLTPSKKIVQPLVYENYTDSVAMALKKALDWSMEESPKGRILIMSGPPGTGKSFAIRGLISTSQKVDWALVPSYIVPELTSPNMIASLMTERSDNTKPLNLIIEDADSLLKKREESNADIISQILNLGDGIFGEMINVKLIMTTNCPRVNMDDAITRRGRLNSFIDFELLPPEQAEAVYSKLANKAITYREPKALCDIYADANDQEVHLPKKELSGNYL